MTTQSDKTAQYTDGGLVITDTQVVPPDVQKKEDTKFPDDSRIIELTNLVKEVSSAPTYIPRDWKSQFVLYKNASTYKLYAYFPSDNSWKSVTLS